MLLKVMDLLLGFCYVEDKVDGLVLAAEKYNNSLPLNLAWKRDFNHGNS